MANNRQRRNRRRNNNQPNNQMVRPPGQGLSKSARRRRNRNNNIGNANNQPRRMAASAGRPPLVTLPQALGEVGGVVGGLVGAPTFGRFAGQTIGKIFGSGDYVIGSSKQYNTIQGTGPPSFGDVSGSARVRHREFLGDIMSTVAFTNTRYQIQPCEPATFPWLSGIAKKYEQYKFHGLVFEYKSTSGASLSSINTALGTVVMVTQYDPTDPSFINKQQAENYMGAQSCSPSQSMLHAVECARGTSILDRMYTRDVMEEKEFKMTDWGALNLITSGSQGSNVIGELWVSYDIELSKPKDSSEITTFYSTWSLTGTGADMNLFNPSYTAPYPSGFRINPYNMYTLTGTRLYFPNTIPRGNYVVQITARRSINGTEGLSRIFTNRVITGPLTPLQTHNNNSQAWIATGEFSALYDMFYNEVFYYAGGAEAYLTFSGTKLNVGSQYNFDIMVLPVAESAKLTALPTVALDALTSEEVALTRMLFDKFKHELGELTLARARDEEEDEAGFSMEEIKAPDLPLKPSESGPKK